MAAPLEAYMDNFKKRLTYLTFIYGELLKDELSVPTRSFHFSSVVRIRSFAPDTNGQTERHFVTLSNRIRYSQPLILLSKKWQIIFNKFQK